MRGVVVHVSTVLQSTLRRLRIPLSDSWHERLPGLYPRVKCHIGSECGREGECEARWEAKELLDGVNAPTFAESSVCRYEQRCVNCLRSFFGAHTHVRGYTISLPENNSKFY